MTPLVARIAMPALLMTLLWLLAAVVKARAVKDELAFTAAFVETVKQRWPGARVDVHAPLHVEVKVPRTRQYDLVSLSDAYKQYRSEPGRMADLLEEHMQALDPARPPSRPQGSPQDGSA